MSTRCKTYNDVKKALQQRLSFHYSRYRYSSALGGYRLSCRTTRLAQIVYSYNYEFPILVAVFRPGVCVDHKYAMINSRAKLLAFSDTRASNTTAKHQRLVQTHYNDGGAEIIKMAHLDGLRELTTSIATIEGLNLAEPAENQAVRHAIETFCAKQDIRARDKAIAAHNQWYENKTARDYARQGLGPRINYFQPIIP